MPSKKILQMFPYRGLLLPSMIRGYEKDREFPVYMKA
jgi:hypothetical protein